MSSNRLAEDNPVLLPPPDPRRPGRPMTAREWALTALIDGLSGADLKYLPMSAQVAAEVTALRNEGIGPRKAAVMLARLDSGAPDLTVIDGGGHSTKRRARLSLVPPTTGRPASAPALPTVA